jgi:hypothetical protein
MVHYYKYYVVGHYSSSYLYLKTTSCLFFKTQRFRTVFLDKNRTMENFQQHNICTNHNTVKMCNKMFDEA